MNPKNVPQYWQCRNPQCLHVWMRRGMQAPVRCPRSECKWTRPVASTQRRYVEHLRAKEEQ
jgi:hypothetical protein